MNTATLGTRKSVGLVAALALGGALALTAFATFAGEQQEDQTSTYWGVALFLTLVTALVFGFVVRQSTRAPEGNSAALSGLITSLAGILTIVAFWSGLPVVLGAAGAVLGLHGKDRAAAGRGRGGMAKAAVALGILAIVATAVLTIGDSFAS